MPNKTDLLAALQKSGYACLPQIAVTNSDQYRSRYGFFKQSLPDEVITYRTEGFFNFIPDSQKHIDQGGWKLHISVDPTQLRVAFSVIAPRLLKYNLSFKVIDDSYSHGKRFEKGMQFTVYLQNENGSFQADEIQMLVKEITDALNEQNITSGHIDATDAKLKDTDFLSLRNDALPIIPLTQTSHPSFSNDRTDQDKTIYIPAHLVTSNFNPAHQINPFNELLANKEDIADPDKTLQDMLDSLTSYKVEPHEYVKSLAVYAFASLEKIVPQFAKMMHEDNKEELNKFLGWALFSTEQIDQKMLKDLKEPIDYYHISTDIKLLVFIYIFSTHIVSITDSEIRTAMQHMFEFLQPLLQENKKFSQDLSQSLLNFQSKFFQKYTNAGKERYFNRKPYFFRLLRDISESDLFEAFIKDYFEEFTEEPEWKEAVTQWMLQSSLSVSSFANYPNLFTLFPDFEEARLIPAHKMLDFYKKHKEDVLEHPLLCFFLLSEFSLDDLNNSGFNTIELFQQTFPIYSIMQHHSDYDFIRFNIKYVPKLEQLSIEDIEKIINNNGLEIPSEMLSNLTFAALGLLNLQLNTMGYNPTELKNVYKLFKQYDHRTLNEENYAKVKDGIKLAIQCFAQIKPEDGDISIDNNLYYLEIVEDMLINKSKTVTDVIEYTTNEFAKCIERSGDDVSLRSLNLYEFGDHLSQSSIIKPHK